jgi:hypothetical protein
MSDFAATYLQARVRGMLVRIKLQRKLSISNAFLNSVNDVLEEGQPVDDIEKVSIYSVPADFQADDFVIDEETTTVAISKTSTISASDSQNSIKEIIQEESVLNASCHGVSDIQTNNLEIERRDAVELESVLTALGVVDVNEFKGAYEEIWEKKAAATDVSDEQQNNHFLISSSSVTDDVKELSDVPLASTQTSVKRSSISSLFGNIEHVEELTDMDKSRDHIDSDNEKQEDHVYDEFEDGMYSFAVTYIQARVRGMLIRRKLRKEQSPMPKTMSNTDCFDVDPAISAYAATIIAARIRGVLVRKKLLKLSIDNNSVRFHFLVFLFCFCIFL